MPGCAPPWATQHGQAALVGGLPAAWLVWLAVHIFWLIGFRNCLLVMINWAWDYLFYERAVRLITSQGSSDADHSPSGPDPEGHP